MKTNKKDNTNWELEAPTLASLPKKMPFKVPNGYFNNLTTQLNNAVFLENLAKKQNFSTPPNYFKELSTRIQSRIASNQITNLVKTEDFKTPVNYFESLQTNILNKTTNQTKKAKIVRLWALSFTKYAAAACFILIIFTTFLYFNTQKTASQNASTALTTEQLLYDIDENTIIEQVNLAQQTELQIPKAELETYILNHYNTTDLTTDL